ncbi:transposase family protein [Streptomyces sp. NPDC005474]|uniref:transposase family protein n=1 Tax=Streptomyces sp. NPDC005474 TaxID=3154878 RepID=UPI0034511D72
MKTGWARAACSDSALCGISKGHLGVLVAELAEPWQARRESELRERRGHGRLRAAGAGPDHQLVFVDRVLVTLVALRWALSHRVLAVLFATSASTIGRAVGEIRPLPAARGFAVPDRPAVRLRTLADVSAYAKAEGVTLRIDGTEVQVRRPKAMARSAARRRNPVRTQDLRPARTGLRARRRPRETACDGYRRALAAHREAAPPSRVDPGIAEAVERQNRAMRELSRRAFPEPDVVPDDAPAPIEQARAQRRRQAAVTEAAALRRARQERAVPDVRYGGRCPGAGCAAAHGLSQLSEL